MTDTPNQNESDVTEVRRLLQAMQDYGGAHIVTIEGSPRTVVAVDATDQRAAGHLIHAMTGVRSAGWSGTVIHNESRWLHNVDLVGINPGQLIQKERVLKLNSMIKELLENPDDLNALARRFSLIRQLDNTQLRPRIPQLPPAPQPTGPIR